MSLNLFNNPLPRLLEGLDWNNLTKILLDYSKLQINRDHFSSLPISMDQSYREAHFQLTEILMNHIHSHDLQSVVNYFDYLAPAFNAELIKKKLAKQHALSVQELNDLIVSFELSSFIVRKVPSLDQYPDYFIFNTTSEIAKIRDHIRKFINPAGDEQWDQAPFLFDLYKEKDSLSKQIRKDLQKILQNLKKSFSLDLQYDYVDGHYVFSLPSSKYRKELGKIIYHSNTGQTLYVEPLEIALKNSRLLQIDSKIQEEIYLFLQRTTLQFSELRGEVDLLFTNMTNFDFFCSKARFAIKFNLSRPQFTNSSLLELKSFFHPLVPNPVLNDLCVKGEDNGFILSGPNTGGKTVLLKSICLHLLLGQSGLYVPSKECLLPETSQVFYFGSDFQNIEEGLSSFAGEVRYYFDMFKCIQDGAIIFMDEIFNSTSSEEASALAISLLLKLKDKAKCFIFLSTHHSHLKNYFYHRKDYISAHMNFDESGRTPLYSLSIGTPGSSHAFSIATSASKNDVELESIVRSANNYLQDEVLELNSKLEAISNLEAELRRQKYEFDQKVKDVVEQERSLQGQLELIKDKELNKFFHWINQQKDLVEELINDVKAGKKTNLNKVLTDFSMIQSSLSQEPEAHKEMNLDLHQVKTLNNTSKVFSLKYQRVANVLSYDDEKMRAKLVIGTLKFDDQYINLRKIKGQNYSPQSVSVNVQLIQEDQSIEINGLGMRLPAFEKAVEQGIDALKLGRIPLLTIIHGHGDGILKGWLKNYLKKYDQEFIIDPQAGNDGSTTIKLANQ